MCEARLRPVVHELREARPFIALSATLYAIGFAGGTLFHCVGLLPDSAPVRIASLSYGSILMHNLGVVALMAIGAFFFGIPTIVNLLVSGFTLGTGIAATVSEVGFRQAVLVFAPHLFFELPGLCLAGAAGLTLPWAFIEYFRGHREHAIGDTDTRSFVTLVGAAVALIGIAAAVEVFLLPVIAGF